MVARESDVCSPIRSVLSWTNLLPFPPLDVESHFAASAGLSSRLWVEPHAIQSVQSIMVMDTTAVMMEAMVMDITVVMMDMIAAAIVVLMLLPRKRELSA